MLPIHILENRQMSINACSVYESLLYRKKIDRKQTNVYNTLLHLKNLICVISVYIPIQKIDRKQTNVYNTLLHVLKELDCDGAMGKPLEPLLPQGFSAFHINQGLLSPCFPPFYVNCDLLSPCFPPFHISHDLLLFCFPHL